MKGNFKPEIIVLQEANRVITNPKDKAEEFAAYYDKLLNVKYANQQRCNEVFFVIQAAIMNNLEHEYNRVFTEGEVKSALRKLQNTCPGEDEVHNLFLKNVNENYFQYLIKLMNKSWLEESVPDCWKIALMVPIHKALKPKDKVSSYRPISMLPVVAKLMERLVAERLKWYMEKKNCYSSTQFGFRKDKSTFDSLTLLEAKIRRSLHNRETCLVVFLDLESAFDRVWHLGLLYKLSHIGLKGRIMGWLYSYLTERTFKVCVEGETSTAKRITSGVPQGAVLSPILFNVLLGDITRVQGVQYFEFADDVAISYSGSNQEAVVAKIEAALIEIVEWAGRWGQVVSFGKTKPMYFTNKRTHPRKVTCNGATFEYIQKHKFLGMHFDSPKLTWSKHIEYLKGSSNKSLSIMKSLSSNTWGADRKILLHYYTAAIRSRIDYGCHLYDSASETIVHQMTVMQNQCVGMALGARNTTPIISLLVEANIEPLDIRRKFLAIKYYSKLMKMPEESPLVQLKYQHLNNFKEDNSFFARANKYIREWQLESIKRDPIPVYSEVKPWEDLSLWIDKEFELEDKYMSSLQINNYFKDTMNIKYRNCLQIYTDGSKNDLSSLKLLLVL